VYQFEILETKKQPEGRWKLYFEEEKLIAVCEKRGI
jgi:hypothetical protein